MKRRDIFHLTILQYRGNKTRHILCCLAISIGVFAMVFLSNIGIFASVQVAEALDTLGLHGLTVYVQDKKNGEVLTTAFAQFMEEEIKEIESATPVKFAGGTYSLGHKKGSVALIGAKAGVSEAMNLEILYGRGVNDETIVDIQNPIVISDSFAKELFGRTNAVGKQFYITVSGKQERYTISGVVEDQMSFASGMLGSYMPEFAYVPIEKITDSQEADQILFLSDADSETLLNILQSVSQNVFGMQSGLAVQNLSGYVEKIELTMGKIETFFFVLASFSIMVAAFTIENSMLSAIREMREELLLYRVIGFRRSDMIRFIMMQSMQMCLIGALIGILFAAGAITVIKVFFLPNFIFAAASLLPILAVVFVLGIVSGIFPAIGILRTIKKELYD